MNRRDFLRRAGSAALAASPLTMAACRTFHGRGGAPSRPNFLFILTDDQRADTLSCQGGKHIQTPALDRLAGQGVRFENAFVTTSNCSPSRASFYTGKYVHTNGVGAIGDSIPANQRTIFEILQEQGWRTGLIGKWHLTAQRTGMTPPEDRRGIDVYEGNGAFVPYRREDGTHETDHMADRAVDFIRNRPADGPFFLTVTLQAPHAPFVPAQRFESLLADVNIPRPARAEEEFEALPERLKTSASREFWKREMGDEEKYQAAMKNYLRLVAGVDEAVGKMVGELDKEGIAGNTVVIFASDNGYMLGQRGLAEKWHAYEASIRVPMIVRSPLSKGETGGAVAKPMALNIDVAPTILDLAGLPIPADMQGRSLAPILSGKSPADWRTSWLYEFYSPSNVPGSEAVRTDRWKYINWTSVQPPVEELYDLANDPDEHINLAGSPEHARTLDKMRAEWARLRKETNFVPWGTHPDTPPEEAQRRKERKAKIVEKKAKSSASAPAGR